MFVSSPPQVFDLDIVVSAAAAAKQQILYRGGILKQTFKKLKLFFMQLSTKTALKIELNMEKLKSFLASVKNGEAFFPLLMYA